MQSHILKVTLAHIRPAITRKLRVPSDFTLADLHAVLQIAFGWQNCHLHEFRTEDAAFAVPMPEDGRDVIDEQTVSLDAALPRRRAKVEYVYDFGDSWIHNISVEQREADSAPPRSRSLRRSERIAPLACLEAKRAGPPEDCGGPFGYAELLEALADSEHEQHKELTEWVGGVFDPERVSLAKINKQLAAFLR